MKLKKWNFEKQKYEPYTVPSDWNVKCFAVDMHETINCASCGTELMYKDGFISRKIHSKIGFGYVVCHDCYRKEWKEEKEYYAKHRM